LSGAERQWNKPEPEANQTIFHTQYRITGTPQAVSTALTYARVPPEDIQRVLNTAIKRDNYQTTMKREYEEELLAHAALKGQKPAAEGYEWGQILWFGKNIKTAVIATKTGEQRGAAVAAGRAGASDSLSDKIRKLGQGKVLDVSNMDLMTGKGVRSVPAPKTAKSGKFGTGTVPIISNDFNKYVRAIQLAYGPEGEQRFANDIAMVRQALGNVAGLQTQAPLVGGLPVAQPSPRYAQVAPVAPVVPGATLAPLPQFQAATVVPRTLSPRVGTVGGAQLANIPALTGLLQ
jgi:hypothetical protein